MDIKDYIHEYRMLQKQKKKVRVADFCRENMLDYYGMVEAFATGECRLEVRKHQAEDASGDSRQQNAGEGR